MAVTKAQLEKMILAYPGARESTAYGHPAWRIGEKFFTRLRDEDNSLVIHVDSFDERDMLLESPIPRCFTSPITTGIRK
jgi:hypothetical protein